MGYSYQPDILKTQPYNAAREIKISCAELYCMTLQPPSNLRKRPHCSLTCADHALVLLVPKSHLDAGQALDEAKAPNISQFWKVLEHFLQAIIGDAAVEVVHVVHTDVGRDPTERGWEIVVRAAVESSFFKRPVFSFSPVAVFKLVLHVERSEEHTSELQSQEHISYAVFCL